ncbi:Uncharacterized protein Fot_14159 [Forsythia ovata]|uniref:Uncharacterized protein n=1 Tax=Forsythia ovata TaxID=205694 RepID=A0ABD1W5Y1_9LAMI
MVAMHGTNLQLQHLMDTDIANEGSIYNTNASVFHQHYVENQPLNVLSYADYPAPDHVVPHSGGDQCYIGPFVDTGLVSLEKHSQIETPRGFIDAWSKPLACATHADYINDKKNRRCLVHHPNVDSHSPNASAVDLLRIDTHNPINSLQNN